MSCASSSIAYFDKAVTFNELVVTESMAIWDYILECSCRGFFQNIGEQIDECLDIGFLDMVTCLRPLEKLGTTAKSK